MCACVLGHSISYLLVVIMVIAERLPRRVCSVDCLGRSWRGWFADYPILTSEGFRRQGLRARCQSGWRLAGKLCEFRSAGNSGFCFFTKFVQDLNQKLYIYINMERC